jgi:hypothetical protein
MCLIDRGYRPGMGEPMKRGVEGTRPIRAEGVPDEEGIEQADVADQIDEDPEEQVNRPDQPGAPTPGEERIADGGRPEDRPEDR